MSDGLTDPEISSSGHPLAGFADALEALLDDAALCNAWTLSPAELQEVLPRLTRAKGRLAEVELRVLREADRQSIGSDVGATHTPTWWAHLTGQRMAAAHAAAKLAERLDDDCHEPTRGALAAGRVQPEQASVVLDAVEALPVGLVPPETIREAEAHLVSLADLDGDSRLDPKALRIAGRKVLDVIAPDVADAQEQALLEAEERDAAVTASFTLRPDGHGSMVGRFKIPVLAGEILAKHLAAIAAPRHQHATGAQTAAERVGRPLRWGQAFTEYVETRRATGTPKAGGVAATIVVTMTLDALLGSGRAATLDTGERISASEARRLACEAGIIPAVLNGRSQILDLGRRTRFRTEPQRVALMLRDRGCAAKDCDWPPGMCHAHHMTPWSRGGRTSVDDGVLLCPRHHALAHDQRYQLTTARHGRVAFARRT